ILSEIFGRERDDIAPVARREPKLTGAANDRDEEYDEEDGDEYEDEAEEEDEQPRQRSTTKRRAVRARRGRWQFPPLELLSAAPKATAPAISQAALDEN